MSFSVALCFIRQAENVPIIYKRNTQIFVVLILLIWFSSCFVVPSLYGNKRVKNCYDAVDDFFPAPSISSFSFAIRFIAWAERNIWPNYVTFETFQISVV